MKSGVLYLLLFFALPFSLQAEVTDENSDAISTAQNSPTAVSTRSQFVNNICVPVCQKLSNNTSASEKTKFQRNCGSAFDYDKASQTWSGNLENTGKIADQLLLKCIPGAIKKTLYDPVVALIGLIFGERSTPNFSEIMKECDQSKDCRRALARYIVKYHHINANGDFQISDQQVDSEIANIPIDRLHSLSIRRKNSLTTYCNNELRSIIEPTYVLGRDRTPYENQKIVYDKLMEKNAFCPSLLKMSPPIDETQLPPIHRTPFDDLTLRQKVVVSLTCYPEQTLTILNDACSDVYSVLVPIPILEKLRKVKKPKVKTSGSSGIVEATLRTGENSEATTRNLSKSDFVSHYKSSVYATERQNEIFIQMAKHGPQPNRRFFDTENSAMKFLNDTTKDKDLVTALTNFHKEKTLQQLKLLQEKYPNIKFSTYSDFKSIKVALDSDVPISSGLERQILADLNTSFNTANKEFADEMARLGVDTEKLGNPETWFRAGFGKTVDEASLAARKARQSKHQLGVLNYNTNRVQGELKNLLIDIERDRRAIASSPNFRRLVSTDSSGRVLPQVSVFDLVRKNSDPNELALAISKRYGIRFTKADAELLLKYSKSVDELSPTILIGKRETPSLDSAEGGLSADFLGLGASNLRGTAEGLAGRQRNLKLSIEEIRKQEEAVTQLFQKRKDMFAETVGGKVICTGDDCVKALERSMSDQDKMNLMNQVANHPDTKGVRMSFVAPNVPPQYQMALATHGESIEKALRKKLEGQLGFDNQLQNITFGLDMKTVRMNQGHVDLLIGKARGTRISARDHAKIQKAFEEVLASGFTYNPGTSSLQYTSIRLVPNPTALINNNQNYE